MRKNIFFVFIIQIFAIIMVDGGCTRCKNPNTNVRSITNNNSYDGNI